jgi:flagellar biogenesis protein FliO
VISRRTSSLAALFFLAQSAAWGQVASPSPFPVPFPSHTSDGMLQVLVYFLLITALLAAGLYFTRTGFGSLHRRGKGERKLVISEARTLGNRQFLIVAEYENRKMLLGVCPGRIDYLSTLSAGGDETFSTDLPDKAE